jgi:hypothetical protein
MSSNSVRFLALELARTLASADILARELNLHRDRGAARRLASDLDRASDFTGDLIHDLYLDRGRASAHALACRFARNVDLADGLASDLDRILASDLNRDLDRRFTRRLVRDLIRHLDLASGLAGDLDRILASDLTRDLDLASGLASDLDHPLAPRPAAATVASPSALRPAALPAGRIRGKRQSATARRLLSAAAYVLPAEDRARYGEEFGSELAELALAGGGRLNQLGYSARVAFSSVRLRAVLGSRLRQDTLP